MLLQILILEVLTIGRGPEPLSLALSLGPID